MSFVKTGVISKEKWAVRSCEIAGEFCWPPALIDNPVNTVNSHLTDTSVRSGHPELVPGFLYSFKLTQKMNIPLKDGHIVMFPKVSILEGVDLTNSRFETILEVLHKVLFFFCLGLQ